MKPLLLSFLFLPACLAAQNADGHWKGAISLPNAELKIAVDLKAGETWSGSIDIPAQGLRGYALTEVGVEADRVRFKMGGIPGEPSFDGKLAPSGNAITGTFSQGAQSFAFALERSQKDPESAAPEVAARPIPGEGAPGTWMGTLEAGPSKLRLALHVSEQEGGALKAKLDSLDQGVELDVDSIALKDKRLDFEITTIQGAFSGSLNADGSVLEGTWTQMGQSFPLTFYRTK